MKKDATIMADSSNMRVTSNLYAALQHLRFKEEDRILWIDVICINQENMAERRHQVQYMSNIYKEAERVVVWLGEGTEESDLIMDSMNRLQENIVKVEGDWRLSAQLWMNLEARPGDINIRQLKELREGMELVLRRPWFRRIWILQEIANARVATVYCGKKSVSARTFAQVPSIIWLQSEPHSQAVLDIMPGLSRKESWWGQKRDLHTLLVKFRKSEATDERDIIYALLGISSDACLSDILLPDYTKSLQQVIRDTTSFLLSHTDQDQSLYQFLHWTLPEFLQNLDSLSSAVLGSASENGQQAMVELLLATDEVELDLKDKEGLTPLYRAANNGHDAIVQLLLATGQVEIDVKDKEDLTPLYRAANNGHDAIVRLLLATDQVDANSKDSSGKVLLFWAIENRCMGIIRRLLATDMVGANSRRIENKNHDGQTLLFSAARNGYDEIVQLLLATGQVDADSKDNLGQTLLSCATENGHEGIVKLLLETYKANIDTEDKAGRTPLFHAVYNRHENIVYYLLEKGADTKGLKEFDFQKITSTLYRCVIKGQWFHIRGLPLDLLA